MSLDTAALLRTLRSRATYIRGKAWLDTCFSPLLQQARPHTS